MSRFRPMAATQAGGEGGDCREGKTGQRARERQLLRERVREGWGQRASLGPATGRRTTQTSRKEMRGFQGMTPPSHPHKHANSKDLSQWQPASVGRGLALANGRRHRGGGAASAAVFWGGGEWVRQWVGDLS